ncbi:MULTISPECIES: hypothetical protein [unclassified Roseovarius]|uniref:hypothetical protein n=1 Tax=unclassified Roseovarius TaxID=2614913 RepID=UPI00273EE146|nr:hypothetical protein [Roseovarius sp. MMSF_3350]
MKSANTPGLTTARLQAELAARWLHLIRFAAFPGAPTFSPSMCHYHAMLDPEADDSTRLVACRAMLASVRSRIPIEDFKGFAKFTEERPKDPYDKAWKTTRLGAELWMIAHLLEIAISGLE